MRPRQTPVLTLDSKPQNVCNCAGPTTSAMQHLRLLLGYEEAYLRRGRHTRPHPDIRTTCVNHKLKVC